MRKEKYFKQKEEGTEDKMMSAMDVETGSLGPTLPIFSYRKGLRFHR